MFIAVEGKLMKNLKTSFEYTIKQYNAIQNINIDIRIYNPVMFHFPGTVLNNTRLEQVYYIY